MKRFLTALAAIALAVFLCLGALAAVPKPSNDAYVYDEVSVLSEDTKGVVVFTNDLLKKACGAEIAVVVIKTTGREDIADYALSLFNSWGIGDKKKQNGVLLLMAISDDDYYALPGAGLDLELSGGTLDSLMREYLEPDFAEKKYDDGVLLFFTHLVNKVSEIHGVTVTAADGRAAYEAYRDSGTGAQTDPRLQYGTGGGTPEPRKSGNSGNAVLGFVIVLVIVGAIVILALRRSARRRIRTGGPVVVPVSPAPRPRTIIRTTRDPWRSYPGQGGPVRPGGGAPVRTPSSIGHNGPVRPSPSSSYTRPSSGGFGGGSSSGSGFGRSSGSSFGGSRSSSSSRSSGFGGGRSFGGGGSRGGGAGRGKR